MKERYERDLKQSWLIFESKKEYQEDYQMKMIKANEFRHLLKVHWKGKDEGSQFMYEISGKVSMKAWFERSRLNHSEMEAFVRQMAELIEELKNYMLDVNYVYLNPEYIFREKDMYYFCYYPMKEESILQEFHGLTEYFVRAVDYADKDAVYLASELHKASMEENYNIGQILRVTMEDEEDREDISYDPAGRYEPYDVEEEQCIDDWVGEQELSGMKIQEEYNGWWKRNLFSKRKRKNLWGEWDSLEE